MSKYSLEEINHCHVLIRVRKYEQRDFSAFLRHNGIFQSENHPRIRKRVDTLYYDIFSVDNRFKYWHECSNIYSVVNVEDVEGFVEFRRDARMHEHVDTSMIRKMVRCNSNDYITLTFGRIYEIVGVESACRTIHIINDIGDEEKCDVRDFIFEKEKKNIKLVKCIKSKNHKDITIGNKYSVVSENSYDGWVEIINDNGIEKAYCDDFFEEIEEKKEPKTVPVREVTWQDVIDEKIPCYFWNENFEFHDISLLTFYNPDPINVLTFENLLQKFYSYCRPIDSAIIIVESKKSENKPIKKKYRPFKTFDELQEAMKIHGDLIINCGSEIQRIIRVSFYSDKEKNIEFINGYESKHIFKCFTFNDGTPFGVLEEVK